MNTPVAIGKKPSKSFKAFLPHWIFQKLNGKLLFWAFLPVASLVLTLGISFLKPSAFTVYLPLLALIGTLICGLWKTVGLSGSYLALIAILSVSIKSIPPHERLWQIGVMFALAIDYFLVLIVVEETEGVLKSLMDESHERLSHLHQSRIEIQQLKQTGEEEKKQLEEEIEKLKQETELRRIEKKQDSKRFELIHSEIEMLNSQKETLITDAFEARKSAKELGSGEIETDQICRAFHQSQESIITLQTRLSQKQQTDKAFTALKRDLAQLRGLHMQLRIQFEEKTKLLSETRKELFHTKGKLMTLELDNSLSALDGERDKTVLLEKELSSLGIEIFDLEEEVMSLEGLVSHVLSQ